jgi:hypothetical protein
VSLDKGIRSAWTVVAKRLKDERQRSGRLDAEIDELIENSVNCCKTDRLWHPDQYQQSSLSLTDGDHLGCVARVIHR